MNAELCTIGRKVYWAGVIWAAGYPTAFVRSGIITSVSRNKVEVEEDNTGKKFTKARQRLFQHEANARGVAAKLSQPRRVKPPRPGCNKTVYPDKRSAQTAINRALKRGRCEFLRAYPCERCRGWHLTRQPEEQS